MKTVILYILVFFSFLEPFNISGDSMEPTFSHGDTIVIDPSAYSASEPTRGDVVVFYGTDEPDLFFVKRIIGLPGETLLLQKGFIYLVEDDEEFRLEEPYLEYNYRSYTMRELDGTQYEVPEDKYFVLGDNRRSSFDSRTWTDPFVPRESIVGKFEDTLY